MSSSDEDFEEGMGEQRIRLGTSSRRHRRVSSVSKGTKERNKMDAWGQRLQLAAQLSNTVGNRHSSSGRSTPNSPNPVLPPVTLERKPVPPKANPAHLRNAPPMLKASSPSNGSKEKFSQYLSESENITSLIQTALREIVLYKPADPLMHVTHFFKRKVDERFVKDAKDPERLDVMPSALNDVDSPAPDTSDPSVAQTLAMRPASRAKLMQENQRLLEENYRHRLDPDKLNYPQLLEEKEVQINRLRDQVEPLKAQNEQLAADCAHLQTVAQPMADRNKTLQDELNAVKTLLAERDRQLREKQQQIEQLQRQLQQKPQQQQQQQQQQQVAPSTTANAAEREQGLFVPNNNNNNDRSVATPVTKSEEMRAAGIVCGVHGQEQAEAKAANAIQRNYRGGAARTRVEKHKAEIKRIQSIDYGEEHHAAAVKLQALHRGRLGRARMRNKGKKPTLVSEEVGGGGESGLVFDANSANAQAADESVHPAIRSAYYEKPEVGVASQAWRYRGPVAEAKAKTSVKADRTGGPNEMPTKGWNNGRARGHGRSRTCSQSGI